MTTATLTDLAPVTHEHHERLLRHVNRMPLVVDLMEQGATDEFRFVFDETCDFLTDLLIPHMEAAERALYPELERVMQNRHSMTPMRREHGKIRAAINQLVNLRSQVAGGHLGPGPQIAVRRNVFRLFAMLRIHMAEELLYAEIVEHGASREYEDALAIAMQHAGVSGD
jgi:hypothetical protein